MARHSNLNIPAGKNEGWGIMTKAVFLKVQKEEKGREKEEENLRTQYSGSQGSQVSNCPTKMLGLHSSTGKAPHPEVIPV